MAFDTLIMTDTEVKDLAVNDTYFDESYFTNYILTSQRKYIKPVLGKDWYNEILTQIETASLTADNSVIVESFIKPALAHYVVYEVYSNVHVQLTNQGSMNNDTEFSDQGDSFDYSQSRDFFINKADFWKVDMIDYIKDEQDDDATKYPLYDECKGSPQVNKKGIIFYG